MFRKSFVLVLALTSLSAFATNNDQAEEANKERMCKASVDGYLTAAKTKEDGVIASNNLSMTTAQINESIKQIGYCATRNKIQKDIKQ
jgi:hypothetical protein